MATTPQLLMPGWRCPSCKAKGGTFAHPDSVPPTTCPGCKQPLTMLKLGMVVTTPSAADAIASLGIEPRAAILALLSRHAHYDYGQLDSEDIETNDRGCKYEAKGVPDTSDRDRILSNYVLDATRGLNLWIITEWNREVTTLLLPEDY